MEFMKEFITENNCSISILACVSLTISYVASLYVWRSKLSRDHPSIIKRRFFSVSCMMILAPFFCQLFISAESLKKGDMFDQLGLRWSGIVQASFLPLLLTAVLFLGPLTMQFLSGIWKLYSEPIYWFSSWQDLVWVRNHVMAPLSEEWVFRACMMPLLLQCYHPLTAVYMGPLLFGIAHFHHMFEQIKSGMKFKTAFLISTFQFMYTSLFGAYSSYLFARTASHFIMALLAMKLIHILVKRAKKHLKGHFVAPLFAHMFCNHMGFPNFGEVSQYPPLQRLVIICNFLLGFALWCFMLVPVTNPDLYDNKLHWDTK